ncbi:hypothetical protein [Nonomuraea sp. NPDC003804]|uniref:hypothetical protein n=1 Tax=Nonomuraea sp. NPDC003804 TaxID=3154547 RepID=UPI0033A9BAD6
MTTPEVLEPAVAGARQAQAGAVEQWNKTVPVGTPVRYWTGYREGDGKQSRTRTDAQMLGGHTAVVWMDGEPSCVALTHVEPLLSDEIGEARD